MVTGLLMYKKRIYLFFLAAVIMGRTTMTIAPNIAPNPRGSRANGSFSTPFSSTTGSVI